MAPPTEVNNAMGEDVRVMVPIDFGLAVAGGSWTGTMSIEELR